MQRPIPTSCLILLAGLILSSTVHADDSSVQIGKGGKLGVVVASISGHKDLSGSTVQTKSLTGYQASLFVSYRQSKVFSYQMELGILSKGYKIPNVSGRDVTDTSIVLVKDVTTLLTYLELPVMAKISLPVRGKYIPYFLGGGYGEYLMSSKLRLSDSLFSADYALANAKKIGAGVILGAGLDIKAGSGYACLEIRYEMDMTSVIKNQPAKNRALTFCFGYWY
jgi:hypothetical protein